MPGSVHYNVLMGREKNDDEVINGARAFAKKEASAAIYDEPSSALDHISENNLFNKILQSTGNRIGIFISHRLSCVKDADIVFMLENGKLVEYGTHSHLMSAQGPYSHMYRIQEKNYYAIDNEEVEAV
jgi:ATP-binding cassette subfamily B protein